MDATNTSRDIYYEGARAFANCDYTTSVANFTRVIELDPEFSMAYLSRGAANLKLRNLLEAADDFGKFIELKPENPKGYHMRGLALMEAKEHERAIADFDRAIDLDPDYGRAYLSRGTAHSEAGHEELAGRDLTTATRMGEEVAQDFMREFNIPWKGTVKVNEEDIFPDAYDA